MSSGSWSSTINHHKRTANMLSEMLIQVTENTHHSGQFWVYELTASLNSYNGLSRTQLMGQVRHSIVGGNKVTVHIICDEHELTDIQAEEIARRFYNGNTHTYRLDK